ncbi:hypothetical protein [Novosphingobium aerophilum]|uniref:Uncharacterized protein n=1 Tax=Novosphingobium aerophilum TaxID=2839843 RepID=A0A7X1F730_9SPHN|nr:hypothetical protein [Novosphingobium aerophilum]MBC2651254.1 hypothetical protein [Novosphingobium aerophilum]
MNINLAESRAMSAQKHHRPGRNQRTAPPHPMYDDEISDAQIDVIRHLADPDGKRAAKRVILYPSLV